MDCHRFWDVVLENYIQTLGQVHRYGSMLDRTKPTILEYGFLRYLEIEAALSKKYEYKNAERK